MLPILSGKIEKFGAFGYTALLQIMLLLDKVMCKEVFYDSP